MTAEQLVRDQLERATHDVEGGPDLDSSIRDGRRRRRTTRVGVAATAVAVLGLGAVGAHALAGDDARAVAHDTPAAAAPAAVLPAAPADFVPGTDIDDSMAAVVAELLPSLPAPDDVYPSDSETAGPIPDSEFARAQDWQASYTTDTGGALVMMGLPAEIDGWRCSDCNARQVAGGTLYHQTYSTDADGPTWWFGTYFVRDDGHFVNAFESVKAPDKQTAAGRRQTSDADLEALVEDPRLSF